MSVYAVCVIVCERCIIASVCDCCKVNVCVYTTKDSGIDKTEGWILARDSSAVWGSSTSDTLCVCVCERGLCLLLCPSHISL
ncbi:hypothetical protein FKM82_029434 [Ascaphus truei]